MKPKYEVLVCRALILLSINLLMYDDLFTGFLYGLLVIAFMRWVEVVRGFDAKK